MVDNMREKASRRGQNMTLGAIVKIAILSRIDVTPMIKHRLISQHCYAISEIYFRHFPQLFEESNL